MKIKKLEIISFGKFSNEVILLDDGLNVLYGKNEAGKSTIAAFIKFMLFGFPKERASINLKLMQKEKYMPWNNDNILGKIYCEYNNANIVVEKEYKRDAKAVKSKVYLEATGEELKEFKGVEPGAIFYNISLETFENTAFLLQNQLETINTDEMEKRLRNIASTGNDDTSYLSAKQYIEKEQKKLGSAKSGLIKEIQNKIYSVKEKLQIANITQKNILDTEKELIKVNKELALNEVELKDIIAEKDKSILFNAKSKLNEIYQKEKELQDLEISKAKKEKIIIEKDITRENIKQVNENILQYQLELSKNENFENEYSKIIKELDTKNEQLKAYERVSKNRVKLEQKIEKTVQKPLIISIFIFALILCIIAPFTLYISLFFGICIGFLGFFMFKNGINKKDLQKANVSSIAELKDVFQKIDDLHVNIQNLNEKLKSTPENPNVIQSLMNKIVDYLKINRFSVENVKNVIKTYENTLNEYEKVDAEINVIKANIAGLGSGISVDELRKTVDTQAFVDDFSNENYNKTESLKSLKELENELNNKTRKIEELRLNQQKFAQELEFNRKNQNLPSDIIGELNDYENQLKIYENRVKSLEIANKLLNTAYNTMQMIFAPELSKKAEQYFESITKDSSRKLYFTKENDITVKNNEKNYPLVYFSTGTKDAIYISLRLAVCDIIFSKEKPILVFDDTFSHFDNMRLEMSLNTLSTISNSFQVLYFTCDEKEIYLYKNANIINI